MAGVSARRWSNKVVEAEMTAEAQNAAAQARKPTPEPFIEAAAPDEIDSFVEAQQARRAAKDAPDQAKRSWLQRLLNR